MELLAMAFMAAVVGNQLAALSKLKRLEERLDELSVEARVRNRRQENEADGLRWVHAQVGSRCGGAAQGQSESASEGQTRGRRDE